MTVRLLPIVLLTGAAGAWFNDVQGGGPYVLRNFVPLIIMLLFALLTLLRGHDYQLCRPTKPVPDLVYSTHPRPCGPSGWRFHL